MTTVLHQGTIIGCGSPLCRCCSWAATISCLAKALGSLYAEHIPDPAFWDYAIHNFFNGVCHRTRAKTRCTVPTGENISCSISSREQRAGSMWSAPLVPAPALSDPRCTHSLAAPGRPALRRYPTPLCLGRLAQLPPCLPPEGYNDYLLHKGALGESGETVSQYGLTLRTKRTLFFPPPIRRDEPAAAKITPTLGCNNLPIIPKKKEPASELLDPHII